MPCIVEHLSFAVRDDATLLIERDAVERRPEVADRAIDRLDGHLAELAGTANPALAIRLGALPAETADRAIRLENLGGLREEVQVQSAGCRAGLPLSPLGEHAIDHENLLVRLDRRARRLVVVEVLVVDDHVDVAQLPELAQLERRELDLHGSPATEDVNVRHG